MAKCAVFYLLSVFGGFHEALSALIHTERTVMAAVGQEAHFTCQLSQSKDVLQVTWKKLSPEGERSVATYNKYFGQRVSAGFQGKVEFRAAGLQNCSIVIWKVTEQDEGCYHCLFNAYPDGALTGTTCLKLYELHEPVLHVESNSSEEAVVSCWATGRPAPTLTLRVLQQHLHLSDRGSVSVPNANGTLTVTRTALLSGLRDDSTQVGCAGEVLSGPQMEVFMRIPEVRQSTDEVSNDNSDVNWIIVISGVLTCVCAAVIITVLLIRKHLDRFSCSDSENIKTPLKTNPPHETKAPLILQDNEQERPLMSSGTNNKSNDPKPSSGSFLKSSDSGEIETPLKPVEMTPETGAPSVQQDHMQVRLRSSAMKNEKIKTPSVQQDNFPSCRRGLLSHYETPPLE